MSYSVPHQRSTPHRGSADKRSTPFPPRRGGSADKFLTFLLVKPPANPTKK
jgi:hypothetical protein